MFSVRKASLFIFLWFKVHFRKALFLWWISVDDRPNRTRYSCAFQFLQSSVDEPPTFCRLPITFALPKSVYQQRESFLAFFLIKISHKELKPRQKLDLRCYGSICITYSLKFGGKFWMRAYKNNVYVLLLLIHDGVKKYYFLDNIRA